MIFVFFCEQHQQHKQQQHQHQQQQLFLPAQWLYRFRRAPTLLLFQLRVAVVFRHF